MKQPTFITSHNNKSNENLTLPPITTDQPEWNHRNSNINNNNNNNNNDDNLYDNNATTITLPPLEDMVGRILHFKFSQSPTPYNIPSAYTYTTTTTALPFTSIPSSPLSDGSESQPDNECGREYYCDSQGRKIKVTEKRGVPTNTSPISESISSPSSYINNNHHIHYNYNSNDLLYISPLSSPTHFLPIVPAVPLSADNFDYSHIAEYFCQNCGKEYERCPHEQRCVQCHSRIRWRCSKCNITVAASQKSSHESSNSHNSHARGSANSLQSNEGYYCCAQCSRVLAQMPHSCCCTMCGKRIRWHCNICQVEVDATGKTPHKKSLKHKRNSSLGSSLEDVRTTNDSNSGLSTPSTAEIFHSEQEREANCRANNLRSEIFRNVIKIQPS